MGNHNSSDRPITATSINQETRPRKGTKLRSKLDTIYRTKYDNWLRSFHLRPSWESHTDLVAPHIWHGYRPNPTSFTYCLKSAFYPTNETMNMWTHLIPGMVLLWKTFDIYFSLENPSDKIACPLWIYSFGCCFVFFCSAAAHLLNCYSASAQELCFCLDYGSIAVFGLTLAVSFQYLTCPLECFGFNEGTFPISYISFVFLLMLISLHLTCSSRYPGCSLRYLYRFGPYAASYCLAGFPCFLRFLSEEYPEAFTFVGFRVVDSKQCYLGDRYSYYFVTQLGFFAVAILFVITRFPEKLFPGTFDIIGHSHQWFHICVAYGMYLQHVMTKDALKEALELRKEKSLSEEGRHFNVLPNFYPLVVLIVLMFLICVSYSRKISKLVKAIREEN